MLFEWLTAVALSVIGPRNQYWRASPCAFATRTEEQKMSKLAVTITAATLCAPPLSLPAEALSSGALAHLQAAIEATHPVEKAACGWYPIDYPQSWAVYNRGWGCRQVYSPHYYDPYVYQPYYAPPLTYQRPYWRPRRWWWAWY
jgi:hypothetical protein